ncbi:MAG TPA: alpha-glucosidase [Candidatus Blautia stercoripullorum]|uniref:Alpha-glucosidase n=1 Tax=Candidatus Blautia stercoripullorum TaxID=2838502 RepID=A0A9D2RAJ2_9FIRM|nr:alpha-glucosidase [Candidatus Blautia stercoripullorum]
MEKKWWHDKVAYQIYPKSFYDSNGDGIGDLQGIIRKLDYLKDLGADILWISPIYPSPFADQGYDISDYYNIDPAFGTMEDMDELIREAQKRDMYILMDLVVNHCSDEHEWFEKACADPSGEYGNFFYIEDRKEGELPCNWRSYFGGPVWEPLPGHPDKQYMHVFHKKQPDLNWENPAVREEVYKNINWWLDKGLGGFRVDAIINIKKKLPYKNYPSDRDDGLCDISLMLADAQGIGEFLGEMQERTFRPHDAFSVGEVFNIKDGELPDFVGDKGYFSSIFDFATTSFGKNDKGWYACKKPTPDDYKKCYFESQKKMGDVGFYSNIIENHDEPRGVSYYIPEGDVCDASKKLLAAMYFLMRGLPFIYQGQEIGMENLGIVPIDKVDDISALDQYQVSLDAGLTPEEALKVISVYSRDNARTPVQWNSEKNAGFTQGTPWLMVNPNYTSINVEAQKQDPDSVLSFYKELIALRKNPAYKETLVYGDVVPYLEDQHNLMAYHRKGEKDLLVIGNFQKEPQTAVLPSPCKNVLLNNYKDLDMEKDSSAVHLKGYQAIVIEL